MKTFKIEFLCFPGLDVHCKLCGEIIKDHQEEIVIPTLYLEDQYQGPICEECYVGLPRKINAAMLQKFQG